MFATAPDGAEIYYEAYDFTDPWKPSETILLHHGNKSTHRMWLEWVPYLAAKYQVLLFDARGRGKSAIPPQGFDWSLDQFVTDALAVADSAGVDRFHWLGTSYGAVVGEYGGAKYGERLKSLSLISPPYRFTNLAHVKEQWLKDYDRLGGLEFIRQDTKRLFPEDADPDMVEWHAQEMASMPEHVWKDLQPFTAAINLADLLAEISVPTLILAATKSDRAPASEAEFMKEQIPNCELVVFDAHHNILATERDKCVEKVLEFIGRHQGA